MFSTAPIPPNSIIPVAALNRLVRECLESNFPLTWVGGEISNLTYAASGHVYFSLKDENAQVRCVMWRSRAQLLGWRLENGQKVEARALVSFYEPRGEFQLNIEAIRRAGQGDLFERFLRLKAKLESEGVFAAEAKRPLPCFPRHIAIVTSPQAAALRDVLTTCVARAIRASRIPVICGVGHETDFTIADFAADLRAPTPTAAAEIVSPERDALLARLADLQRHLVRRMERSLAEQQQRIDWLASRLIHPTERIRQRSAEIQTLGQRLRRSIQQQSGASKLRLINIRQRLHASQPQPDKQAEILSHLNHRLHSQVRWHISQQTAKLNSLTSSLKQLDPKAVLARGYVLAVGPDGRAVRDATSLCPGNTLKLNFAHGSAAVTVDQVVATTEAD